MTAAPTSTPVRVRRTYYALILLTTLSASLIWGINTLFLLDAGLSNLEAFAANGFFTLGMVVFEVPTGVVADVRGRRLSFLIGAAVLSLGSAAYVAMWWLVAPFWAWAAVSIVLGLGFTFFSGALIAWVVDALDATGYDGDLDGVLGRGQAVEGAAMLVGSVAGGVIAQLSSLGVPFVLRALMLVATFVVASVFMHDLGFSPVRGKGPVREVRRVLEQSVQIGLGRPHLRWVMLTSPFLGGALWYGFYAMQPYLLELYGDADAYAIAGLAAAIVAGAQIVGGMSAGALRRRFRLRTTVLLIATALGALALLAAGLVPVFGVVIAMLVLWGLTDAAATPVRQAYINECIPAAQRATVLSFDSLLNSAGGAVTQPAFGRVADVSGYAPTFVLTSAVQALAIPFFLLARREGSAVDEGHETVR